MLRDPLDGSPPGSAVPGILRARTLEWAAIPSPTQKVKRESEAAQLCPTLQDPMDCSPPGSSVHGILQARVLEWGAIAFSKTELESLIQIQDFIINYASQASLLSACIKWSQQQKSNDITVYL